LHIDSTLRDKRLSISINIHTNTYWDAVASNPAHGITNDINILSEAPLTAYPSAIELVKSAVLNSQTDSAKTRSALNPCATKIQYTAATSSWDIRTAPITAKWG
jgi:hypothetical protein